MSRGPATRPPVEDSLPGEAATVRAARAALTQQRRGLQALWPFLGPGFIASVAYVDPGNFATNLAAGAEFGFLLLWAVLASNLAAMLVQSLSAKLGVATGRNLPELCRDELPRLVVAGLWVQGEVVAMATDLAEVLGAALGLELLFGISLRVGALLAGAAAFLVLGVQRLGFRRLEGLVAALVGVIVVGFAFDVVRVRPPAGEVVRHLFVPGFAGSDSVLLAVGILGATVMPHVIYLHSALTQNRIPVRRETERRAIQRFERLDVVIAMTVAGLVNLAMLVTFATLFGGRGRLGIADAFGGIEQQLGCWSALVFGVALLASGLSSSSVGTMAGQVIMQGFIRRSVPLMVRRAVTLAPALVLVAAGADPSHALVWSQVVLSLGIPFALVPLVLFTGRRDLMGGLANGRLTALSAWAVTFGVVALNLLLVLSYARAGV